jgi:hypothetical protein
VGVGLKTHGPWHSNGTNLRELCFGFRFERFHPYEGIRESRNFPAKEAKARPYHTIIHMKAYKRAERNFPWKEAEARPILSSFVGVLAWRTGEYTLTVWILCLKI